MGRIRGCAVAFTSTTGVHGLDLLRPKQPLLERLLWLLCFAVGLVSAALFSFAAVGDFMAGETSSKFSFRPAHSAPFPPLRICHPVSIGRLDKAETEGGSELGLPYQGLLEKLQTFVRAKEAGSRILAHDMHRYISFGSGFRPPLNGRGSPAESGLVPQNTQGLKEVLDEFLKAENLTLVEMLHRLMADFERPLVIPALSPEEAPLWSVRSFLRPLSQELCYFVSTQDPALRSLTLLLAFRHSPPSLPPGQNLLLSYLAHCIRALHKQVGRSRLAVEGTEAQLADADAPFVHAWPVFDSVAVEDASSGRRLATLTSVDHAATQDDAMAEGLTKDKIAAKETKERLEYIIDVGSKRSENLWTSAFPCEAGEETSTPTARDRLLCSSEDWAALCGCTPMAFALWDHRGPQDGEAQDFCDLDQANKCYASWKAANRTFDEWLALESVCKSPSRCKSTAYSAVTELERTEFSAWFPAVTSKNEPCRHRFLEQLPRTVSFRGGNISRDALFRLYVPDSSFSGAPTCAVLFKADTDTTKSQYRSHRFARLRLGMAPTMASHEVLVEFFRYDGLTLTSLLGGNIGLFTGASFVSFVHVLFYLGRCLVVAKDEEVEEEAKPRSLKEHFRRFASQTSLHWLAQASAAPQLGERVLWTLGVLLAAAATLFFVSGTVRDYRRGETTISRSIADEPKMPRVFTCHGITVGRYRRDSGAPDSAIPSGSVAAFEALVRRFGTDGLGSLRRLTAWAAHLPPMDVPDADGNSAPPGEPFLPLRGGEQGPADKLQQNDFGTKQPSARDAYAAYLEAHGLEGFADFVFAALVDKERPLVRLHADSEEHWRLRAFLHASRQQLCWFAEPRDGSSPKALELLLGFRPEPIQGTPTTQANWPNVKAFQVRSLEGDLLAEVEPPSVHGEPTRLFTHHISVALATTQYHVLPEITGCDEEEEHVPPAWMQCQVSGIDTSACNCTPLFKVLSQVSPAAAPDNRSKVLTFSNHLNDIVLKGMFEAVCGPWSAFSCYEALRLAAPAEARALACAGSGLMPPSSILCTGSRVADEDTEFYQDWLRAAAHQTCLAPSRCRRLKATPVSATTAKAQGTVVKPSSPDTSSDAALTPTSSSGPAEFDCVKQAGAQGGKRSEDSFGRLWVANQSVWDAYQLEPNGAVCYAVLDGTKAYVSTKTTFVRLSLALSAERRDHGREEQVYVLDLTTTVGLAGGLVGLFLGASIISFVHAALHIAYAAKSLCSKGQRAVSPVTRLTDDQPNELENDKLEDEKAAEWENDLTIHGPDQIVPGQHWAVSVFWVVVSLVCLAGLAVVTWGTVDEYLGEATVTEQSLLEPGALRFPPLRVCHGLRLKKAHQSASPDDEDLSSVINPVEKAWLSFAKTNRDFGFFARWAIFRPPMNLDMMTPPLSHQEMNETATPAAFAALLQETGTKDLYDLFYRQHPSSERPLVWLGNSSADGWSTSVHLKVHSQREQLCYFFQPLEKASSRTVELLLAFPPLERQGGSVDGAEPGSSFGAEHEDAADYPHTNDLRVWEADSEQLLATLERPTKSSGGAAPSRLADLRRTYTETLVLQQSRTESLSLRRLPCEAEAPVKVPSAQDTVCTLREGWTAVCDCQPANELLLRVDGNHTATEPGPKPLCADPWALQACHHSVRGTMPELSESDFEAVWESKEDFPVCEEEEPPCAVDLYDAAERSRELHEAGPASAVQVDNQRLEFGRILVDKATWDRYQPAKMIDESMGEFKKLSLYHIVKFRQADSLILPNSFAKRMLRLVMAPEKDHALLKESLAMPLPRLFSLLGGNLGLFLGGSVFSILQCIVHLLKCACRPCCGKKSP